MKHIMFGIALLVAAILVQLAFPAVIAATLTVGAIGLILAIVGYVFCR